MRKPLQIDADTHTRLKQFSVDFGAPMAKWAARMINAEIDIYYKKFKREDKNETSY